MTSMEIVDLAAHPAFIPLLASWHLLQWGYMNPGQTQADVEQELRAHLSAESIPTTYIALHGDTLMGSASLLSHDMHTRPELSPWLASLYVAPAFRRQGVGEALVRQVVHRSAELGVPLLYLFTPDQQAFYGKRGWRHFEDVEYKGHQETIMTLVPSADY